MLAFDKCVSALRAICEDLKSGNHENDEQHIQNLKAINEAFLGDLEGLGRLDAKEQMIIHRLMNYICSSLLDSRSQLILALGHYSALEDLYLKFFPPKSEEPEETKDA